MAMKVVLRIEEGPEKGREIPFEEADNYLIGRADPQSQADLNIGPEDEYVSRNHFYIEVRPPNCLIRDNQSTNGTYVRRRGEKDFGPRIEEVVVEDGDQIKIGRTILSVGVIQPEPVSIPTRMKNREAPAAPHPATPPPAVALPAPPPTPAAAPQLLCIRCQKPLDSLPSLASGIILRNLDFMCGKCRGEVLEQREREAAKKAAVKYACWKCGADVTRSANSDGLAVELSNVALYLCKQCAEKGREGGKKEIGGYSVLSELGHGGMGVVYKVWHPKTGRLAALKQVLPIAKADKDVILRFMREINIMENLQHQAIVRLYEAGQDGANPFFISEFAPNGSLGQFTSRNGAPKVSPAEALQHISAALTGLAFMHEHEYVHRDIKPENILLRQTPAGALQPKLADFGLARNYERHGGTITKLGEFAGTIMYMPPEQIKSCRRSRMFSG